MTWEIVSEPTTTATPTPTLVPPTSSAHKGVSSSFWKMLLVLLWFAYARAVNAHVCTDELSWDPNISAYISDENEYLIEMEDYLPEWKHCSHFFNETTICYDYQRPTDYIIDGRPVKRYEFNRFVYATECSKIDQNWWHLHDISHREPLEQDPEYCRVEPQPETTVYILDTYVDIEHREFEGRARVGVEIVAGSPRQQHGTHVAALVGGKLAGVNKRAKIVSVVVLNDMGAGTWAQIIQGLEWVAKQQYKGVINMSIGGPRSTIVNNVIRKMTRKGYKIVVAAGNEASDACGSSPASERSAVTVGAVGRKAQWAKFSNHGPCVDILAPGDVIGSALPGNQYGFMSGTSMASPLVAGVWSLFPHWDANKLLRAGVKKEVSGLPARTTPLHVFNSGMGPIRDLFSKNVIEPQQQFIIEKFEE